MNAEIPDAQTIKNRTIRPNEGIPNISASKIIRQKAMIAIFLNLNDFSAESGMNINFFLPYYRGSALAQQYSDRNPGENGTDVNKYFRILCTKKQKNSYN
jgi:hypothetical protein